MAHRAAPLLIFIAFSGSGLELMSADRVTPPDNATGLGRDVCKAQIAILGGCHWLLISGVNLLAEGSAAAASALAFLVLIALQAEQPPNRQLRG
ncbi:hypothetical protein HMPREF3176_01690 [Dermabacter sp. HMSC08H10]|nr:hypothetical protein HMPREF3176_01690 [Dermabacter sp. HMSC08H10]